MPADAPGTLKPAEDADVMAFLFSKAGMPAGQIDLPSEVVALRRMKYIAR